MSGHELDDLRKRARGLLDDCRRHGLTIVTAESCTGGLAAAILTDIAGSSDVFERGFVTYSNVAKVEMLGVEIDLIEAHGAVSESVARSMALGALSHSHADLAVSITGVAGPEGGSADKPVGLVHIGGAVRHDISRHRRLMFGDVGRDEIRRLSIAAAFDALRDLM